MRELVSASDIQGTSMAVGGQLKKSWTTPHLRVYGKIENITQGGTRPCDKTFGPRDGYTFQGAPIYCAS